VLGQELPRRKPQEAAGDARTEVIRAGRRAEVAADVGEEEEEHVLIHRERQRSAADVARPGQRGDGNEAGRRAEQKCTSGFAEADDGLLRPLDVSCVQGERPAGEPQALVYTNRARLRCKQRDAYQNQAWQEKWIFLTKYFVTGHYTKRSISLVY
jgi:hypothetical protein